ncbi:MAG: NADH-quinone oxidoreductase subunit C [Deltaproteobacteria bacterium]|nr:MAG: NADH-quinone oxidoreductase subunit C [Deltaproteobacteria bacterium]
MTFEEIHQRLAAKFGDRIGPLAPANKDAFAPVQTPAIVEICEFLKTDPELAFDCLINLSSVDWPKKNQIEVVYHFWSYQKQHSFIVKCLLDRAKPELPSVTSVWNAANWLEREQFDLMGVVFTDHPDLRRIMLPDDWVGNPLRKDYAEQPEWHNITTTRESPLDGFVRLDELVKKKASEKKEVLQ